MGEPQFDSQIMTQKIPSETKSIHFEGKDIPYMVVSWATLMLYFCRRIRRFFK